MYQVNYKYNAKSGNSFYNCCKYDDLDIAARNAEMIRDTERITNVTITAHAFENLCEANVEIDRLRKLLSNAYTELQQLKRDYNEFLRNR